MAATGYTPIVLYNSTTASNVPTTGNLQAGELALNIADGKLFFNKSGTITTLSDSNVTTHLSWTGGSQQVLSVDSIGALTVPIGSLFTRPPVPLGGMLRYEPGIGFVGYQTIRGATIVSMTNVGTTATVKTASSNKLTAYNTTIDVLYAVPGDYQGRFVATYVDDTTFTYTMLSNPGGPATVNGSYTFTDWALLGTGSSGGGSASAGGAVYENAQSITSNYTMTINYNGESVGPITVAPSTTVTIPSGSRWVIL